MSSIFEFRFSENGYGVHIFIQDPTKPVVYTFDNLWSASQGLRRNGWGFDWLKPYGLNIVSLMETEPDRRYRGIDDTSILETTQHILSRWKFTKRIAYGSSMGGYAALAFAEQLSVDTVAAICPISSLNADGIEWENRFSNDDGKHLAAPWRSSTNAYLRKIRSMVLYDPLFHFDTLHTRSFPCERYKVPGMGHALEKHANPLGIVKFFFDDALTSTPGQERKLQFAKMVRRGCVANVVEIAEQRAPGM